ncbi:asparagine--tRNA ligase [Desulfosarcina alkanivorans]|jgi:asparaginyl-tRNA synthetase|uniref:Asparagine--tRNA ligase n=1 Tax=Desulfosarcina alkanivorans TaxID=571177 RepID=A0A5K7Z030_9BACT|nr:asparagine--tRNA ligase [Desulfosarcina alkanivorans]BBO70207.1 asparagine--tRNA ligase [Desulfosarcina alkanivorans]
MKRHKIAELLKTDKPVGSILIKGWVRTKRNAKTFSFIEVNDGSCLKNMQIVVDGKTSNYHEIKKLTTGSAVAVRGKMVPSQGGGQQWEVQATNIDIISMAPETFPLQKKRHTDEYLRTIAHLRPRTNKYGSIFRIRSELAYAVHHFFRERGFRYIHTPVITGSDCEGAGELFRLTTLNPPIPMTPDGKIDYSKDFFGMESNLTVSGQLSAEMFALALGDVYTFGPTFRAENSNTSRHVAEFWMIEPEMAFCDLAGNMNMGETLIKHLISFTMDNCAEDLALFARFVDKTLMNTLENIVDSEFVRIPYQAAIDILLKSKQPFSFPVAHGADLQSEHERYLTEKHFKKPVIIYDYPKTIKPFYMRLNDDGQTVGAMDIIVPRIGELVGGSQREERLDVLEQQMASSDLSPENYWWYLESRRFGTVPHSGFGLGFERLLMLVTGVSNIRDVIPFPRTPGNIEF